MKVLYTGSFRFPDKDAAGKRVFSIVDELSDRVEFTVVSWEQPCVKNQTKSDDFIHVSTGELDKEHSNPFERALGFLFRGFKTIKWLKMRKNYFDLVILYNPPFIFSLYMYFWSVFNGVKIVIDSTEWYESEHLIGGRFGLASLENFLRMRLSYPMFKHFIVMSDFLESYYSKFTDKRNIIKVPPLAKEFKKKSRLTDTSPLRLMYAGSPGKKDKLDVILNMLLNSEIEPFHLTIAGVSKKYFLNLYPNFQQEQSKFINKVTFLGRVPMEKVYSLYSENDYVIFARENKRYALAGFPSKFVESISYDTPVMTNSIGDISNYIELAGLIFEPDTCQTDDLLRRAREKKNTYSESLKSLCSEEFSSNKQCKILYEFFLKVTNNG